MPSESRGALTLEVFKGEYRKLLEAYFADAMAIDPSLDLECLRIPHFTCLYVYKYATGLSAAVTLSSAFLRRSRRGENYLGFLNQADRNSPRNIARRWSRYETAEPINRTIAYLRSDLANSRPFFSRFL